jgi:hypothetical protein
LPSRADDHPVPVAAVKRPEGAVAAFRFLCTTLLHATIKLRSSLDCMMNAEATAARCLAPMGHHNEKGPSE